MGEQIYRLRAFKRFIKGLQMTQNDPKIVKILLFVVLKACFEALGALSWVSEA